MTPELLLLLVGVLNALVAVMNWLNARRNAKLAGEYSQGCYGCTWRALAPKGEGLKPSKRDAGMVPPACHAHTGPPLERLE